MVLSRFCSIIWRFFQCPLLVHGPKPKFLRKHAYFGETFSWWFLDRYTCLLTYLIGYIVKKRSIHPLQSIVLGFVVCYVLNKALMHLLCFLFQISRSTALFHLQIGMNINCGMVIISMDVNRHIDKYLINYS